MPSPIVRLLRLALSVAVGLGASCLPQPRLQFFTTPDDGLQYLRSVTDTVLVLRQGESDSASLHGLHLTYDLLDRADTAQRTDAANRLRAVLDAVPAPLRRRTLKPGSQYRALLRRLQRQHPVIRMDLMRSDALIVTGLVADTVERVVPAHEAGQDRPPGPVTERWLAVILTGEAYLQPGITAAR